MTISSIYLNLPVRDIQATRTFWAALGFGFNEKFSDEKALCLELNPPVIYAMLLETAFFKTFTDKPVSDGSTAAALLSIQVESRARVDELVALAVASGARRYGEALDHGWMYFDRFEDLDGHQWEVMYADESLIPETP